MNVMGMNNMGMNNVMNFGLAQVGGGVGGGMEPNNTNGMMHHGGFGMNHPHPQQGMMHGMNPAGMGMNHGFQMNGGGMMGYDSVATDPNTPVPPPPPYHVPPPPPPADSFAPSSSPSISFFVLQICFFIFIYWFFVLFCLF